MKQTFNIATLTKPVSYSAHIEVANATADGSSAQLYDNMSGRYSPDRTESETVLQVVIDTFNPNTGKSATATVTAARWYVDIPATEDVTDSSGNVTTRKGDMVRTQVTSTLEGFAASTDKLTVKCNIPYGESGRKVYCEAEFNDPVGGGKLTATARIPLTTSLNTANDLSLCIEAGTVSGAAYAGYGAYTINALTSPNDSGGTKWKVRCRVQLKDGNTVLASAYQTQGTSVRRMGSAFYFWYLKNRKGELSLLSSDTEWFACERYADGTMAQECVVDLSHINDCTLVAKAGFVPYGEYTDYLGEDGTISQSQCQYSYLRQEFRLGVYLPQIDRIEVAPISYGVLHDEDFADTSATVIMRKCLVTADKKCVNLLKDSDGNAILESLYNIVWKKTDGTTETVIGNGEDLSVTLAALGATDKDHLPQMSVEVEPKYPDLFGNNYCVGYDASSDDVVPIEVHGNKSFLGQLDFMLYQCDTTNENDDGTYNASLLQRNNLLHYVGGGYAPVVGITAEQEAECGDNALYSDSACTTVAYEAGKYNAVTEWEQHDKALMAAGGQPRTLYKKADDGTISEVSHKLRPWETTRTDLSIGVGYTFPVYLLDQVRGDSGKVWKGIFTDVTEWDGIDLTPYRLEPTAMGPGCFTTIGNKARNLFYVYKPSDANCQVFGAGDTSSGAHIGNISWLPSDRAYPRVVDVHQVSSMTYCRGNNKDTTAPYPQAEGGYFALDTLITAIELMAGTKYIADPDLYGSGISGNDKPTAANFFKVGGVKYKKASDTAYTYNFIGVEAKPTIDGTTYTSSWSAMLNFQRPHEACMESQMAASMAVELGIEPTTASGSEKTFYFYGGKYYYMTAGSMTTPADGMLNARVYKIVEGSYTDDNDGEVDVEYRLRMSLYAGAMLSGDILVYCGGGAELVVKAQHTRDDDKYDNPVAFWLQPSQKEWKRITSAQVAADATFGFEDSYLNLIADDGSTVTVSNNWRKNRTGYTPFAVDNSSKNKGDCMYIYNENWYDTGGSGKRTRLALRFGLNAYNGACAPRSLNCTYPASSSNRYGGGRAQTLVRLAQ